MTSRVDGEPDSSGSVPTAGESEHAAVFAVEPWCVREPALRLDALARTESVFALGNGHLGVRGNLDEGEPHAIPGTYLNSVFARRPLPYAERGYGYPESGETVLNVTNGKLIRLLVDDEPFDVRYGRLEEHERVLDLRTGTLRRRALWRSPTGRLVKVTSTRLVSMTHRSVIAIDYQVEAVEAGVRVVLQSELVANEAVPTGAGDPRSATDLGPSLEPLEHDVEGLRLTLLHRMGAGGIQIAAAADHQVSAPDGVRVALSAQVRPDWGRVTATASLAPGQGLRLVKYVSYGWSEVRSVPALRDQVAAGLVGSMHSGWEGLLADQRATLDEFWLQADVEIDGDPELQQGVRFALFHILQAGVRAEQRPIAAKGLTGPGYDGHCFWDTETFVLAVLVHTWPHAAADALRWRHSTLPAARERARQLGLEGAAFPWRTISGRECSSYWPAGTAAFHINADIADAVTRHHDAAGDETFDAEVGLELLVETARLWRSLGHLGEDGGFHVDGVTGPDEYSAVADDNVYTLLMAQRNLRSASTAARNRPAAASALGVDDAEVEAWLACARGVQLPYDGRRGVHAQARGFTDHAVWDFEATPASAYPLLLHAPYYDLYRKQVVKQADLVLAMHLCGNAFTPEQKAANFAYYEAITVRDSSLSACTQAVLAAEVGCLDLAYEYAAEAALMDLLDLEHNTRDGLHLASLAGAWLAVVAGFGGMRDLDEVLHFAPRLPTGLTRLSFTIAHRGLRLKVETDGREVTYRLADHGQAELALVHHGEPIVVTTAAPVTRPVAPPPPAPEVRQPAGRAPWRRRIAAAGNDTPTAR